MPDLSVKSKGFTLKSCVLQFQTYSSDLCPFLFFIFLIKVSLVDLCSHRIIETNCHRGKPCAGPQISKIRLYKSV